MNRYFQWTLFALIAVVLAGCEGFNKKSEPFYQTDLHGLWLEEGTQHYVRYLPESANSTYEWGKEWDEAQGVYENRLVNYGNGWFKYGLKYIDNQNKLTQINMMDNGGADIPQVYIVTVLTGKRLEYYHSEDKKDKHVFNKVSE